MDQCRALPSGDLGGRSILSCRELLLARPSGLILGPVQSASVGGFGGGGGRSILSCRELLLARPSGLILGPVQSASVGGFGGAFHSFMS